MHILKCMFPTLDATVEEALQNYEDKMLSLLFWPVSKSTVSVP